MMLAFFFLRKEKMTKAKDKPRGRPPAGAVLKDGQWILTDESAEIAAQRLLEHRAKCRERYRETTRALKEKHPDLFRKKRNGERNTERYAQTSLRGTELPVNGSLLQGTEEKGDSSAKERC
jgi:hypothetical protein